MLLHRTWMLFLIVSFRLRTQNIGWPIITSKNIFNNIFMQMEVGISNIDVIFV